MRGWEKLGPGTGDHLQRLLVCEIRNKPFDVSNKYKFNFNMPYISVQVALLAV